VTQRAAEIPDVEIAVPVRLFAALLVMAQVAVIGACATEEGVQSITRDLATMLLAWPALADIGNTKALFDECTNLLTNPTLADSSPPPPVAAPTVVFQPGAIMVEQPRRGPARIERLPDGSMVVTPA
jgi:hypothetical protein